MTKKINLKDYNELKIETKSIINDIVENKYTFPKYTTQIINLANQTSQGTRPKYVGQMSELIKLSPEKTYNGWKKFYIEENDGKRRIEDATDKTYDYIKKLKEAINLIDRNMVREWIEDLILVKTAEGLIIQEAILKYLAKIENTSYRLATPEEESKGIDGVIGDKPVQIKSKTYTSKDMLPEEIQIEIIYYGKTDDYITIFRK